MLVLCQPQTHPSKLPSKIVEAGSDSLTEAVAFIAGAGHNTDGEWREDRADRNKGEMKKAGRGRVGD